MTTDCQKMYACPSYLSICQQCIHSLEEARLQHVGLIQDEDNLLIPAARATQHGTKVIIKVSCSVLAVNLMKESVSNHSTMKLLTDYCIHFYACIHKICTHTYLCTDTYLDLEERESIDPGHEPGEGCLTSSTHTNQQ